MKSKFLRLRSGFFSIFLLLEIFAFSQSSNTRYWIAFKDKSGSPFSTASPQQYLSPRSIARRAHHNFITSAQDFPPNPSYVQQVSATGAEVLYRLKWFNGVVVRITNPAQLTAINALSFVLSSKSVARIAVERSHESTPLLPTEVKSNASTNRTMSNRFNYGAALNQINLLNGTCLHNMFYDGRGMEIAELDDGFLNSNINAPLDSLRQRNGILFKKNIYTGDTTSLYSIGGHGSSVLSCMAANQSGSMVGTAPYANFYLLRTEIDSCEQILEEYDWVAGMEFADSAGADVVTSSLGYNIFDDPTQSHTWASLNGRTSVASLSATYGARRGLLVCVAAGNEGQATWRKITIPSDADSILAVGAVDATGIYASFSSQGYSADHRVKPDVASQGLNSTIMDANSGSITTSSGTSFATPILAGLAACLWQANPTKTNMQIIQAIKQSASQFATPDSFLGYGIPNFCNANQLLGGPNGTQIYVASSIAGNQLTIIVPNNTQADLTLEFFDITGRMILSDPAKISANNGSKQSIYLPDLSSLPPGMYIVRITSSNGDQWVKKIMRG